MPWLDLQEDITELFADAQETPGLMWPNVNGVRVHRVRVHRVRVYTPRDRSGLPRPREPLPLPPRYKIRLRPPPMPAAYAAERARRYYAERDAMRRKAWTSPATMLVTCAKCGRDAEARAGSHLAFHIGEDRRLCGAVAKR